MNIKDWPCWAKVGAGVILAIFVLNWPSGSEWAAWVQAFGSIGAICGAVWLSEKSKKELIEREKRAKRLEISGTVGVIENVLLTVKNTPNEFTEFVEKNKREGSQEIPVQWIVRMLDTSIEVLGRIPMHEFPYSMLSGQLGREILWLKNRRHFFDYWSVGNHISYEQVQTVLDFLNESRDQAEEELKNLPKIRDDALRKVDDFY